MPLAVLSPVAEVYAHRHYDLDGETPQERLASLFAGDEELVQAALAALRNTIGRADCRPWKKLWPPSPRTR